ncbi:hypothetical protein [Thioclava sp. GXIMD4216]|uniref:Lipoprotein n=1 Tax=Thioclava litoralis TaxID=3076557 RepID=A0ABZ1E139_9RHOB|nr:hypothetical protein RPE78_01230 [Thioclava sp. FTW29]
MRPSLCQIALATTGLLVGLSACASAKGTYRDVTYQPVETRLLQDDLVEFRASVGGKGATAEAATDFAACAAAQYSLIRGFGFARHIRTTLDDKDGLWRADAVYTISPALPRGLRTIDAEVTVSDCADRGIPTV